MKLGQKMRHSDILDKFKNGSGSTKELHQPRECHSLRGRKHGYIWRELKDLKDDCKVRKPRWSYDDSTMDDKENTRTPF
ncbi:hypothetical protein DPMN_135952 [Dreissena polymorpha]|uniref:Uncharacterized protein n=1 Tax=Dreissena polymorpha TaxID=45954 RepID=A0A9D4JC68_DREPO|nr:hypothetical protein DPMN_135952 [Dreissena polymorpha]